MNRKFLFLLSAGLIGALGLLGLGCEMCCNSSQGNGSIMVQDTDSNTSHQVNFSYRVSCVGTNDPAAPRKVKGHFEYRDAKPWKKLGTAKTDPIAFHGTVDGLASTEVMKDPIFGVWDPITDLPIDLSESNLTMLANDLVCAQNPNLALFTGSYVPHPNPLGEAGKGRFVVVVQDNGQAGVSPEDVFVVKLEGGAFDGYVQKGTLARGNIKAL